MIVIPVPYDSPPLRSNKRLHHMAEHRIKHDVRYAGKVFGLRVMRCGGDFPITGPVEVRMIWTVPTRHVRDADAGQPTLKSLQDGLVDAGLILNDSWQVVHRSVCEIEHRPGRPMGLRIEIEFIVVPKCPHCGDEINLGDHSTCADPW